MFPRVRMVAGFWVLLGFVVLAVAGAGVAVAGVIAPPDVPVTVAPPPPSPARPLPPVPAASEHIRYDILGTTAAGLVSFTRDRSGLVQPPAPLPLPWRSEFDAGAGFIPTVTAQNAGDGAITCRITVEGTVVSEVTSEGPRGVATCTGNVIAGH